MDLKIRKLRPEEVEFRYSMSPDEEDDIEGNFAYDTEAENQAAVKWIRDQLEIGNQWAWFCIRMFADYKGHQGSAFLGGCSYASKEQFMADPYYADLKKDALEDLNNILAEAATVIFELVET